MKRIKEIRFKPMIEGNDLRIRLEKAKAFLKKGHQVRVTVLFWGKHSNKKGLMQYAEPKLERFAALGKVISAPKMNGSKYTMIIA